MFATYLGSVDNIKSAIEATFPDKGVEVLKGGDHGAKTAALRSQVLGQLSSRLSYDRLYQEAILDPSLKRTQQEIEVAMANASLARNVVFELFQDLDKFNLGDYRKYDDAGRGMQRLVAFVQRAARLDGGEFRPCGDEMYELRLPDQQPVHFTTNRDKALDAENLNLLGLEHPAVKAALEKWASLEPTERAVVASAGESTHTGLLTFWHITVNTAGGQTAQRVIRLGLNWNGERVSMPGHDADQLLTARPAPREAVDPVQCLSVVSKKAPEVLHREILHAGLLRDGASYSTRLLACMAVALESHA